MSKKLLMVFAVVTVMLVGAATSWAAISEVSQPVQVTNDTYYERGQSIVYDGTDYWIFYGRSASETGNYQAGTPDVHDYEVYYKKASTVPGLVGFTPAAIPGASNSYLGETGAAYYGSEVWAFATIDVGATAEVYGWYTTDGSSWTQVSSMVTGLSTGSAHHDEIAYNGELYIMVRRGDDFYTTHSSTPKTGGWSTEVGIGSAGGLAHFFLDGGTLYLAVLKSPATRMNQIFVYNSGTDSWSLVDQAASAGWDPTLFKVGSYYVFVQAPWTGDGGGRQYNIAWAGTSLSTLLSGGTSVAVTEGKYGSNTWVDMWPIGFTDNGSTSYLFFTSERNPSDPHNEGTGNIWYLEYDWDVTRDHYTYIQEAVDAAAANDIVNVAPGLYQEDLTIYMDNLELKASGAPPTIKGVSTLAGVNWPTAAPNIDVRADNVKIHGLTITSPDVAHDYYSSGIVLDGIGNEIYNNTFTSVAAGDGWCVVFQTWRDAALGYNSDISGLDIHDNEFGGTPGGGYVGVFINHTLEGTGTVTVQDNEFRGDIAQGVFTERYNTDIKGNDLVTGLSTGLGLIIMDFDRRDQADVSITGNTVESFDRGIVVGHSLGQTLTNIDIEHNCIKTNGKGVQVRASANAVVVNHNCISGNTTYGVENTDTGNTLDASANWWGSTDAATVAAGISGNVDYTPWLDGGSETYPGFDGDFSTLYVDDDSPQTGATMRIQEAVDLVTASTVNVMDGTYGANVATGRAVYIIKDGLNLIGQSQSGTIIDGAVGGVGSSGSYWPKGIHVQADNVTLRNLTVQGFTGDLVSSGGYGVLFRDYGHDTPGEGYIYYTGGTVENVTSQDNYSAMYALVHQNLTVHNCLIQNNVSDGMFIARESDGATITDNTVLNSGDHGIWVGKCWTGIGPSDNATITGNAIDGAREGGITFCASDGATITGNTITNVAGEIYGLGGLSLKDGPSNVTANYNVIYGNDGTWGGHSGTGHGIGIDGTPSNIDLKWNSVYANAGDGCHNYSTVSVDATHCWWGDASGPGGVGSGSGDEVTAYVLYDPWIGKTGGENIVCVPDPQELTTALPVKTVDVDYLGGGGGLMYGYSMKFSWDGTKVSTATGKVTQGSLLSDQGTTQFFPSASGANEITVDCVLLGAQTGVTGPGTMFTVEFTGLACGVSDIDITIIKIRDKDNVPLSGFYEDDGEIIVDMVDPVFTVVNPWPDGQCYNVAPVLDLGASDACGDLNDAFYRINGGTWAADAGLFTDYSGSAWSNATWTLPGFAGLGQGSYLVEFYCDDDVGNTSAIVGWNFMKDTIDPPAVTGFDAAPGHEKVHLSWTNPGSDFDHVVVVRKPWAAGAYPEYVQPPALGYPTGPGDGTVVYSGTGSSYDDPVVDRSIYFYHAFVYDCAGNYTGGTAPGGSIPPGFAQGDRATNYWLGDVTDIFGWIGPRGFDGVVDVKDINNLSSAYWLYSPMSPPATPHNECDVGPTDDYTRLGLPVPDDYVDFEDLMILAMNYGVVTPLGAPVLEREEIGPVALRLEPAGSSTDELVMSLVLGGNVDQVKGVSVVLEYDAESLELKSASPSEALSVGHVFFNSTKAAPGEVWLDLAVLGTGQAVRGSGEVARLVFSVKGSNTEIAFAEIDIRGIDNMPVDVVSEGYEPDVVPTLTRLLGARPNPFTPGTTVHYELSRSEHVVVEIYDTRGRLVRQLVNGVLDAGPCSEMWDGTDSRGNAVHGGVYFVKMRAGSYESTTKLVKVR